MEHLIARKYGNYKKRGNEIIVETCPFCESKKYKFSINPVKGVYKCWRGSCGASGHISQLFPGESIELKQVQGPLQPKKDKKPIKISPDDYSPLPLGNTGWTKTLNDRGISRETASKLKILIHSSGKLAIPLQEEEGKVCGFKYRSKEKRILSEPGSKMVLFNYLAVKDKSDIIITEGEIDCLTLAELNFDNVCSVPCGTSNMDWIEYHWEWLQSRDSITLLYDNDSAGDKAFTEASKRLGYSKIKVVDLGEHNDINDYFMAEGSLATHNLVKEARLMEIPNVKEVADIKADEGLTEAISYGCNVMDKLMAGHRYKEVTVYSGTPGSGKSTLVNNLTCNLIEARKKVFVYSGEFKADKYKRWLLNTICTPEKLRRTLNKFTGEEEAFCPTEEEEKINRWLKNYLYVYDSDSTAQERELLDIMLEVRNRLGVRIFVIDNLMTVKLEGSEISKWDNQKYFLQRLHDFAVKYDATVHLVAHPKKTDRTKLTEYTMYDISGSSDIPNLVDNIVFLKRLSEEEKANLKEKTGIDATTGAILCKDRENGRVGEKGLWQYSRLSRRFIDPNNKKKNYNYETLPEDEPLEPFPFE